MRAKALFVLLGANARKYGLNGLSMKIGILPALSGLFVVIPEKVFLFLFSIVFLIYYLIVQSFGLTTVHPDVTSFFLRNQAMFLSYLNSCEGNLFNKIGLFVDYSMISIWAPLMFVINNVYVFLIGDLLPLTPSVMLFPKAIIVSLTAVYAYLLGRDFHSKKLGIVFALMFGFAPWVAVILRGHTFYSLLSSLFQIAVFYHYSDFIRDPQRPVSRLMAPLMLAFYMTTGLDWPLFVPVLFMYFISDKKLRDVLRNRWNMIPLAVVCIHLSYVIRLFVSGLLNGTGQYGLDRWKVLFLSYPFTKIIWKFGAVNLAGGGNFFETGGYLLRSYGIAFLIAMFAAVLHIYRRIRQRQSNSELYSNFVLLNALWLVIAVYPFLKSGSDHASYAFTLAVPVMFLASTTVAKWRMPLVVGFLAVMAFTQWFVFFNGFASAKAGNLFYADDYRMRYQNDDDRRVLAAACFLIENRAELLGKDKTALMPYIQESYIGNPGFVDHYARGLYTRLKPWAHEPFQGRMPEQIHHHLKAKDFVYGDDELRYFDWIILGKELVSLNDWINAGEPASRKDAGNIRSVTPSMEYYRKFVSDGRINWLGCFRDSKGRELWLGEVRIDGVGRNIALKNAPIFDVDKLATVYEKKYDRVSYLKQGLSVNMAGW